MLEFIELDGKVQTGHGHKLKGRLIDLIRTGNPAKVPVDEVHSDGYCFPIQVKMIDNWTVVEKERERSRESAVANSKQERKR